MLELKNISKQFGQHKIFDNYNLTVEEGKILAIVGPSGGGENDSLAYASRTEPLIQDKLFMKMKRFLWIKWKVVTC